MDQQQREKLAQESKAKEKEKQKATPMGMARDWLTQNHDLERNSLSKAVEINGAPLDRSGMNGLYTRMKMGGIKLNKGDAFALFDSDLWPTYCPLSRFMETYKRQKPSGHLQAWCDCVPTSMGFDDKEFRPHIWPGLFTKWFVQMFGMVLSEEPLDNPLFLAFMGKQGTGKTTLFKTLLPRALQPYVASYKISNDRDFWTMMTQKILIYDDELTMRRGSRSWETFKNLTSKNSIDSRGLYTEQSTNIRRTATLAGTGNILEFLSDFTGNRRIIPVEVTDQVKWPQLRKVSRELMVVEAVQLWEKKGPEAFWLNQEELDYLEMITSGKFKDATLEDDVVSTYLAPFVPENDDRNDQVLYSNSMLVRDFQEHLNLRVTSGLLGRALTAQGYQKKSARVRSGGQSAKYWMVHRDSLLWDNHEPRDPMSGDKLGKIVQIGDRK